MRSSIAAYLLEEEEEEADGHAVDLDDEGSRWRSFSIVRRSTVTTRPRRSTSTTRARNRSATVSDSRVLFRLKKTYDVDEKGRGLLTRRRARRAMAAAAAA